MHNWIWNLGILIRTPNPCVNHSFHLGHIYQNWAVESILSFVCWLVREQLLLGCAIKKNRQKREILVAGAGNWFPHQNSFFLSPTGGHFLPCSLSVSSFLRSSGAMGTDIAVTCQAFRHLLRRDEKNIRCGRAEKRQWRRDLGTWFGLGMDIFFPVGITCAWRGIQCHLLL